MGGWRGATTHETPANVFVPGDQPLAALAVYLLEPQSDDGLVTWNVFDPDLSAGRGVVYPVLRLVHE
jgi:hypothetical protein